MNNKKQGLDPRFAALILVLAVVASGVAILLSRKGNDQAQEAAIEAPLVDNLAESTQTSTLPSERAATSPSTNSDSAASVIATVPQLENIELPSTAAASGELETILPVGGETIAAYAMDCLSYNETTRDWRVHNGIDLAAEEGAPVIAAADGTVYTTYEDDSLGYTVVIRHAGGYTTRYSSLQKDLCVEPGDTVTMGQTIGYAGDTALVETVMGAHVHFSVSCQDAPMNPADFLKME